MIGQLLLHYRVVEKIGEGGQGTVYKVIDTTLDRPAVIKVLPPDLTDSASNLARFEREAKLASSLDHTNICTIFGLHKVGDIHFIAMQYIEGRNVRQLVDGQPLDLRRALSIAIQVTDALAAAHSRGIVHRDIKARNVMVTRSGTVKVLDFGLAKLIEPSSSRFERSATNGNRSALRNVDLRCTRAGAGIKSRSSRRRFFNWRIALRNARGHVALPWQDCFGRALRGCLSQAEANH